MTRHMPMHGTVPACRHSSILRAALQASAVIVLLITLARSTLAADPVCTTFRVRPQDQIWIVSTRCLGCPAGGPEDPYWQVWRYENGWWQPSSSAEFYKTDAGGPVTPIYIHGNRYDHSEAIQEDSRSIFNLWGDSTTSRPCGG
jgi:hypothetical protein